MFAPLVPGAARTLPLESQESLPFNPMETGGSPMPGQITTPMSAIVNYVINSDGGL